MRLLVFPLDSDGPSHCCCNDCEDGHNGQRGAKDNYCRRLPPLLRSLGKIAVARGISFFGLHELLVLMSIGLFLGQLGDGRFMALIDLEAHDSDFVGTGALESEGWRKRSGRAWNGRIEESVEWTSLLILHTAATCSYEDSRGTKIGAVVEAEQFLDPFHPEGS